MNDALKMALDKRARLLEEMALLDQYIELHARLFGGNVAETISENALVRANSSGEEQPIKRRNNPKLVADKAEKVIRSEGRPVQRGELVRLIEASGLEIHSDDKGKYIGTIMWRERNRFESIEGEGYWLVGVPRAKDGSLFESAKPEIINL